MDDHTIAPCARSFDIFRRVLVVVGGLATFVSIPAHAQRSDSLAPGTNADHRPSLFTRSDAWILGGFIAGTVAIRPFDKEIANEIREPGFQANGFASHSAKVFNFLGDPGTVIGGVALYGIGRIGHFQRVADLGLHGTEAVIVSGAITYVLKGIAGRQRPSHAGVNDPDDFKLGAGFGPGGNASFPSGHATAAFAAATIVTLETRRWWPKSTWYIAPVMFGGATMVGVARLYTNAHWASDVVMGAGIGTITAFKVFRFNHVTAPGNRVDRWLLGAVPAVSPGPSGRGAMMVWSFAAPR
jgi:membrane-associated phospholipid phosphatase